MGKTREEEDDADSWSQTRAPRFPHGAAKRRALDPAMSQASSAPRPSISSISTRAPPSFEVSSTPGPAVPYVAQHRTWGQGGLESSRRGEWWSKELGAPIQVGVDFVPDTQDGGGDEFIFIPNTGGCKCAHDAKEAESARARRRAHEQVQRLRQLFPPIPSLADQLHAYVKSSGQDDKLLRLCGINTATNLVDEHDESKPLVDDDLLLHDESKPLVDHGSESPFSNTWFGSMFKSDTADPVPSTALFCFTCISKEDNWDVLIWTLFCCFYSRAIRVKQPKSCSFNRWVLVIFQIWGTIEIKCHDSGEGKGR